MRNKNFDADLLKTLNEQPMPAAPLTDDEFARVLDAACAKLPQAKKTVIFLRPSVHQYRRSK